MILNLTGIRGCAALWVVFFHFRFDIYEATSYLDLFKPILNRGYLGVDLFFFLSGFILGYVYLDDYLENRLPRSQIVKDFFIKRFARLYPVYFSTTLAAYLLYYVAIQSGHEFQWNSASNFNVLNLVKNLFGVQSWDGSPSLNGPSWSVSVEFFAYLVFPIFVFYFFNTKKFILQKGLFLFFFSFAIYVLSHSHIIKLNPQLMQALSEFFMGLAAYIFVGFIKPTLKVVLFLRASITLLLLILLYTIKNSAHLGIIIPILLLILVCTNYFHNVPNKGLSRTWIVQLGLWSYSLYLTHTLFQFLLSGLNLPHYFENPWITCLELTGIFGLTLALASFTMKLVENPSRRILLKLFK
jgi:peptidoglycan/LPS O-acetylase OafA/YrhL